MFPVERIKIIKKYLHENQKAEVAALSELLSVSEVTIRRDLEKLEKEGFLTRTHGGAILAVEEEHPVASEIKEQDPLLDARKDISQIARQLISDNDVIMIAQGPTNLQLAKQLDGIHNLTVLTNDLLIALELSRYPAMKVIVLGGDLGLHSKALYGQFAINSLHNFNVQKLFFEVDGFNLNAGLTVSSIERSNLISQAVTIADRKIILCPASLIGKRAFFPLGPVETADMVVTNPEIPNEYKDFLYQKSIKLYTSIRLMEGRV